ncbi:MAG: hypothetical protein AB8G14_16935 [Ilumatobacter sp.]
MRPRSITALSAAVVSLALAATSVAAAPGGRIDRLSNPVKQLDTRGSGKVTEISVGSGLLQVWVLNPDTAGFATLHPCDDPVPTDRSTLRLDPANSVQFTKIATSDDTCLTSTTPVDVIVEIGGDVAAVSNTSDEQYVSLPLPVVLSTERIATGDTLRLARPPDLSANATAAVLGLEILEVGADGFLSAYGCDSPRPLTPDVSYERNRAANIAMFTVDPGEDLCIFASGAATVRTTLAGELRLDGPDNDALPPRWSFVDAAVPAPSLLPINPLRVLDTRFGIGRNGTARLDADAVLELALDDLTGPITTAVSMNVTAVGADANGFMTVWPCAPDRPTASNINFTPRAATPNLVVTPLSSNSSVCISASRDVHVLVDVNATFEADGGLGAVPINPTRVLDTRNAIGIATSGRLGGGNEIELQVTGGDIDVDAGAATLNITATGSDTNGFVTVYPCDEPRPTASNLNFRAGQASPNLVTSALSAAGTVCLYASQPAHLIADLAAWYGLDEAAGLQALPPTRVLDTRDATGVERTGRLSSSGVIQLDVGAGSSVPDDAVAVVMNVTAAQSSSRGFITVWPCDEQQPTASNLNVRSDRNVANLTTVKLSAQGTVCVASSTTTHVIADVAGFLTDQPVTGVALELSS